MQKMGQNKKRLAQEQYKMKCHEFKEVGIKNRTCYYSHDIIELEDFNFDNILIDQE